MKLRDEVFPSRGSGYVFAGVTVLAMLVPALALISASGGPTALYLAALLSMGLIIASRLKGWDTYDWRPMWPIAIALAAPLTAMLLANSINGSWSNSELEKLLRFALVIPIVWVLLQVPKHWLRCVQWSLLFSAYAGSAMLLTIVSTSELGRNAVSEFGGRYNAVAFANLTLFFGFASWLSLPWTLSRWPGVERTLKILAGIVAVAAVWISGTRSSWGLFVVLCLVLLASNRHWSTRIKLRFVGVAAALMVAGAALLWHSGSSRFHEVWSDIQRYEQQDRDTSVGIRIQLWTASWLMFKDHPVAGVGVANFRDELAAFQTQDVVTALVAAEFGEPHNDFVGAMAGYGMLGLLSIAALYFIPALVFLRRVHNPDVVIRTAAVIGLLFTLGYAQFSLTEMMFRNMRSVPIYAVTLAIFFALSCPLTCTSKKTRA